MNGIDATGNGYLGGPEDGGQGKKLPADGRVRGPGTGRLRVGDWKIPLIAQRLPVPKLLHRAEAHGTNRRTLGLTMR